MSENDHGSSRAVRLSCRPHFTCKKRKTVDTARMASKDSAPIKPCFYFLSLTYFKLFEFPCLRIIQKRRYNIFNLRKGVNESINIFFTRVSSLWVRRGKDFLLDQQRSIDFFTFFWGKNVILYRFARLKTEFYFPRNGILFGGRYTAPYIVPQN